MRVSARAKNTNDHKGGKGENAPQIEICSNQKKANGVLQNGHVTRKTFEKRKNFETKVRRLDGV